MGGPNRSKPPRTPRLVESGVIPSMWPDDDGEASQTDQTALISSMNARSKKRPAVMVMAGSSAGRVLTIATSKVTLGRSKQADFTLTDQGISRLHCEIASTGGGYSITDLGSTNGTLVNGGRIDCVPLKPGDRIQLGPEAVLQFDLYDEEQEGLANKLYEAATRDLLTRALNRRAFQERLVAEVAYAIRHREKLVAIAVDIDHFKSVNDSYGHAAGDSVLSEVGAAVASTLRNEDVFARMGGEEFALLGRGLSLRNGLKMAERIRKLVEERVFVFEAHRFRVTLSAGVAELAETGSPMQGDTLLQLADARLYAAKRAGRNRVATKV